jgi:hypothetical protein
VKLRLGLASFNNIIFNINIVEDRLVYLLPVYPAKERGEKKG